MCRLKENIAKEENVGDVLVGLGLSALARENLLGGIVLTSADVGEVERYLVLDEN